MQRITSLAACRELGGLAACSPGVRAWKRGPTRSEQVGGARSTGTEAVQAEVRVHQSETQTGADGPQGNSDGQPAISVVPDPIAWIRCKVIMHLINLYCEVDADSVEFQRSKAKCQKALYKLPLHQ